jgi:hypothetical protein
MNAKFDMPRGVIQLEKGPYAGKLFICAEHNSACGVFDLRTGEYTTLFQAKRVPTNPAVQLGYNPPWDTKDAAGNILKEGLRKVWGMPGPIGSVQSLNDCQFVHPCQAAEMSDGRIAIAHHDAYQISIVDLREWTITYFADFPLLGSRTDALPNAWPTIFCDKKGAFGGKDDIFACTWFQSAELWIDQSKIRHSFTAGGWLTCEGSGDMTRQFAYPRVLIPGLNGELLYNGDDGSGVTIIRAKQAEDPKMDRARYDRGNAIYRGEGTKLDGTKRAAFMLSHGPMGQNWWGGLKCSAQFAEMDGPTFHRYWKDFGGDDLLDTQLADMRYFLLWNAPNGVDKLRKGLVV